MKMLINRTTMEEKKARARRNTRIFRCLAGAALAAFVLACALTRTGNARAMLIGMMAGLYAENPEERAGAARDAGDGGEAPAAEPGRKLFGKSAGGGQPGPCAGG